MTKVDSLIQKAERKLKPEIYEKLLIDNPFVGKAFSELLDYMSGDNYKAPEMHTPEWGKYIAALMNAPRDRRDYCS